MGFFNKKLIATCILVASITACSSTDEEEEDSQAIAELVEIEQQFKPSVKWSKGLGSGVKGYFSRITPLVAYDKVYTANRKGDSYALDAETGQELWSVDLSDLEGTRGFFDGVVPALVNGGPVAGINKVFYGTENGDVYALDSETGEMSWKSQVKGEVVSAPAIDSGILVINSASGILKAFNASNGEEVWNVVQDVPALTLRGTSAPVISSGGVILGTAAGELTVYILESGQQGWTAEVGEATGSTELEGVIDVDVKPLVYGDKIYAISSRGNLVSIELRTGRVLWKRKYSSYRNLAMKGNTLFLTDLKGHVYAINRNNGLERWSQLALTNRGVTGPLVDGKNIVVGDYQGYLHWLDIETGDFVARHYVDGSGIYSTPSITKGVIYAQSRAGNLQAITSAK